jgi:hypothetical protein
MEDVHFTTPTASIGGVQSELCKGILRQDIEAADVKLPPRRTDCRVLGRRAHIGTASTFLAPVLQSTLPVRSGHTSGICSTPRFTELAAFVEASPRTQKLVAYSGWLVAFGLKEYAIHDHISDGICR